MPELMEYSALFGVLAAILSRFVPIGRNPPRRMPLWISVLIGIAVAYGGLPAFGILQQVWRATPFLPEITSGMVFVAIFVVVTMQLLFESRGQKRRVPIWAVLGIAVSVALALPPLMYMVTGAYPGIALRADVNHCTRGMRGEVKPRSVTNICDFPIIVGLCMPDEQNPATCLQSTTLAPGAMASFDPGEARLSYAPGNRDGLTVVACRPPNRPSRMLSDTGRRHEGICVPGLWGARG